MTTALKTRLARPHGQRTRRRILDAAIDCLVECGYAGTTTVAIQARAEVSRGSLLHHFPSRDELLVAAVAHMAEARFAALVEQVERAVEHGNRIDAAVEAMWDSFQGPLFVAATELWLAARTHPGLRAVLEPAERALWRRFRAGYQEVFAPFVDHPRFLEVLDHLINAMRGVALTRNFNFTGRDAAHVRSWKRLAHELLEGTPSSE